MLVMLVFVWHFTFDNYTFSGERREIDTHYTIVVGQTDTPYTCSSWCCCCCYMRSADVMAGHKMHAEIQRQLVAF